MLFGIEHPEITWAQRTGYPSWLQDHDVDEEEDCYEEDEDDFDD